MTAVPSTGSGQPFPAAARLRTPREFEAVLSGGKRVSEKLLTAAIRANALSQARLGLAIAARNVPAAVDRNRLRRQARESFRMIRAQLPAFDIVLLARSGAGTAPRAEVRAMLDRLWQRVRATGG